LGKVNPENSEKSKSQENTWRNNYSPRHEKWWLIFVTRTITSKTDDGNVFVTGTINTNDVEESWLLDSGASDHICAVKKIRFIMIIACQTNSNKNR